MTGPGPVRDEDAFDTASLAAWLSARLPGLRGALQVGQYAGGASNRTYLLSWPDRTLVLRRPPAGARTGTAHDVLREARVLQRLAPAYRLVPAVLAACDDRSVIGDDFFVMERLDGLVPGRRLDLAAHDAQALGLRAVDALAALHAVDVVAAGLADLGRGPGYVGRQVAGWSARYRAARTPDVPDFAAVTAWLDRTQPPDVGQVLVHNDFRLDNLVLDPVTLRVRGVLDWEMATVGDPLMDLGGALAYWVQADDDEVMRASRRQPTDLPGMPTRAQVVAHYGAATGLDVGGWPFYEVFGLFRLAVIVQQIWQRYSSGATTNPAFAGFGFFVAYLESRCTRLLA